MAQIKWIIVFTLIASAALAHPNYIGRSGAPGLQTCAASCHGIGTGTVTLNGFPTSYSPNQNYLITIQQTGGAAIANFNGSCRVGTGSVNAGVITAGTGTSTYNTTGETNGIHMTTGDLNSATFNWMAPAAGTGTVRLYVGAHQDILNVDGPNNAFVLVSNEAASVPNPPQNLVVRAILPHNVLNWNPVAGASSYNVYRDSLLNVQTVPANLIGTTAQTAFTDSNVTNSSRLIQFYVVTAVAP